jgi:hypothetical protein
VGTELSGSQPTAQSRVWRAAAPKPRLWIYEKEAMAPQPESGLALFSSLEGVGHSSGDRLAERSLRLPFGRAGSLTGLLSSSLLRERGKVADWSSV